MKSIVVACFTLLSLHVFGQNPKLDKLELFYAQHHYKKVLRRANQLIDNPDFDFSEVPDFYQALGSIQLSQNDYWRKKNPNAFDEGITTLIRLKKSVKGKDIIEAHQTEIEWLYEDMLHWATVLKYSNEGMYKKVVTSMTKIFDPILIHKPIKEDEIDLVIGDSAIKDSNVTSIPVPNAHEDVALVQDAKEQLGVPYKWSGTTPQGFDCSGFTSFVHNQNSVSIPRRSEDQYTKAKKVKRKHVQPGDLVFFKKNGKVNHVGVIISTGNDDLVMIHSSTSKGVILTNVEESEYWKSKIHGYGTFIH